MIIKVSYRDQVKEILLGRMKSGVLNAGDAISLAQLSRELEVSVTPIREALTQLEQSNIIKAIPNRGFIVCNIEKDEVQHLYEMVACLEVFAVEHSEYDLKLIQQLKLQQEIFKSTKTAIDRINADMIFHEILVSGYNNPINKQILEDLKMKIFFYEKNFMEAHGFYEDSEHHHDEIIRCLESNNPTEAANILKENWMQILKL